MFITPVFSQAGEQNPKNPRIVLETSKGKIVIEPLRKEATRTVKNAYLSNRWPVQINIDTASLIIVSQ